LFFNQLIFSGEVKMQKLTLRTLFCAAVIMFTLSALTTAQTTAHIQPAGTTSIGTSQMGNAAGGVEIDPAFSSDSDSSSDAVGYVSINRSIAKKHGVSGGVVNGAKAKSNAVLTQTFDALNLYAQRYANGGNQFTVEPPDQGLCVGNGYVMETVNDVLRIFDTAGNALTGPVDLNSFYGYPAALNRTTLAYGPSITDPSCYYDSQTQRFYHVVLTLDRVGTTSALTGRNHLDIAVSNTSSPLGTWTIYKLDVTDDGADGTPNHHCPGGPCLGDYPHIGADGYGFYITTNEFAFYDGYYASQIYALSKRALAAGGTVAYSQLDTGTYLDANGLPGFTVWPSVSVPGQYDTDNKGTEFFLSSDAVFYDSGFDNQVRQWTLTNTSSLDSASPNLSLSFTFIPVTGYGVPPKSTQKAGNYPLGQALGDPEPEQLDSNDSRMQQVYYANGNLWAALDTGVTFDGVNVLAGAAYFVVNPNSHKVVKQGYIAVPNNNVTYPAIAATSSGRGAVAFTLTGPDFYPSAAYAGVDSLMGAGAVQLAASGAGPWDGFTGYPQYSSRSRWGDYGAAVVDGSNIWTASEYIGQTCTLAQWEADFTCGGTRAQLGNWGTRISQLNIK
jgi:hypothetical protein